MEWKESSFLYIEREEKVLHLLKYPHNTRIFLVIYPHFWLVIPA